MRRAFNLIELMIVIAIIAILAAIAIPHLLAARKPATPESPEPLPRFQLSDSLGTSYYQYRMITDTKTGREFLISKDGGFVEVTPAPKKEE